MAIFDDRRKGFEEKFRWEEKFSFKLTARRNRPQKSAQEPHLPVPLARLVDRL